MKTLDTETIKMIERTLEEAAIGRVTVTAEHITMIGDNDFLVIYLRTHQIAELPVSRRYAHVRKEIKEGTLAYAFRVPSDSALPNGSDAVHTYHRSFTCPPAR